MADKKISLKNKIMSNKHLYAYLIAFFSSAITFIFFYFSNEIIKEEKIVNKDVSVLTNIFKDIIKNDIKKNRV